MTWTLIIVVSIGAYALKAAGLVGVGVRDFPAPVRNVIALVPAAVLSALIVKDTFTNGHDLQIDARAVGVAIACVAVWRKVPLWIVIVLACAATGTVRAIS